MPFMRLITQQRAICLDFPMAFFGILWPNSQRIIKLIKRRFVVVMLQKQ